MYSWLIRQLCVCSGEDYVIICKCRRNIRFRFALIGFFVVLICIACFISAMLFMTHLFQGATVLCFIVGAVWAMMITNLYLLVLYTITPSLLPVAPKRAAEWEGRAHRILMDDMPDEIMQQPKLYFSFSYVLRLLLIGLMAVIITQPFNVLLCSPSYQEADRYASEIKRILHQEPLSRLTTALGCLVFFVPVYCKFYIRILSGKNYDEDFENSDVDRDLLKLRNEMIHTDDYEQLVRKILTLDLDSVKTSDFYFQKTLLEMRLVLEEYELSKKIYTRIFADRMKRYNEQLLLDIMPSIALLEEVESGKYQSILNELHEEIREQKIEKYEYWVDAPFRTKHKQVKKEFSTEEALLRDFYGDNIEL